MPELEQKSFQRQIAYKVKISDILNSSFKKDELSAGYIILNGMNVSRINLIGALVYKSEEHNHSSCIVDDGSGKISLKAFNNPNIFSKIDIGDAVLIIGKIREFSNERYVMPEILKKTGIEWLNLRKAQINNKINAEEKADAQAVSDNSDDIFSLIRSMDKGDGVSFEDIIKNSKAESIINNLLKNGDIFEIKPGKLKVLE